VRGLTDKIIVVAAGGSETGGPSIGGAASRRLGAEGAKVVVGDINVAAAERSVELITEQGGTAIAVAFDASDPASIEALIGAAVSTYGGVDGLFYNAMDMSAAAIGVDGEHDLVTLPLEVWDRTLAVGVTGLLLSARAAIPHIVERGGGSIVATASGAVWAGEPVRVAYATAKTAMTAVVRHIASAYGRKGIRANAVAPGFVPAPTREGTIAADVMRKMVRYDRLGLPEDIGNTVAFLLSDDGAYVNGQIIAVDGGTILGR
jgi:NAD(P)-dependent dehydrogenase (short-subunit alcohol dehydrogenase family)